MATDEDFTIQTEDDRKRYDRMKAIFNGDTFDDTIITAVIAGIFFLDEDAGVHSDDDRIVVVPGYAMWLPMMVTFVDPFIAGLVGQEDRELTEAEAKQIEARLRDWFQITFEMEDVEYPANIAGKTIWAKVVDDELLGCACASTRADGTVIMLPHHVAARQF